ncbi:MAG: nucleotidyl transferase AbiEii/AbiGii toxin family protein [Planctomycetes bacterium]|nr:nucleotidyl transferase AbiEii/AbiGii toxin family protein [Planctomycetota bacterium]
MLAAFFAVENRFVLTGGGALIGYHLQHRRSDDLDLFAKPPVDVQEGIASLLAAAARIGASVERLRTFPEFCRVLVRRGDSSAIVDLAVDRAPDLEPPVVAADGVRMHSLREIGANKVCALLGRAEVRDLVDLRAILARGADLVDLLRAAERKDGGVSAATLAWLLDSMTIGDSAELPGGVTPAELDQFRRELVTELRRRAFPPA